MKNHKLQITSTTSTSSLALPNHHVVSGRCYKREHVTCLLTRQFLILAYVAASNGGRWKVGNEFHSVVK